MTLQSTRELVLSEPAQLTAMGHPVRTAILNALEEEPASAQGLARRLGMTHGKTGHHLRVLERAGLVEVVATRKVRALTERLYGPTFDRIRIRLDHPGPDPVVFLLEQAAREAAPGTRGVLGDSGRIFRARMTPERAAEFARRLDALAEEFAAAGDDDGPWFGLAAAVYATIPAEADGDV